MKMNSTLVSILGAMVIAGGLTGIAIAAETNRSANQQSVSADPVDVLAIAERDGSARVMVYLAEPAGMRGISQSTTAGEAAYGAANLALQGGVLSSAFGKTATALSAEDRGLRQIEFIPAFALKATAAEIRALRADPRVASVVENRLNKPFLTDSVGIVKMTATGGGYAKGATGKGRVVAVLDTGVNSTHEFMSGKVISEACYNTVSAPDGVSSRCPGGDGAGAGKGADCISSLLEGCGHGSHVAGIAAGRNSSPSAGEPLHGIAKNGSILAINVFSAIDNVSFCGSGSNPCVLAFDADIIAGLQRVYQLRGGIGTKRIAAANMSLGGGLFPSNCNTLNPAMTAAIKKLRDNGIATVIANGNAGALTAISYPACISKSISVGSTSKRDTGKPERVSVFSNNSSQTDAYAPGGEIGYPFGSTRDFILSQYDAGYASLAGTSMASPTVAGVIAALKSRKACRGKSVSAIETGLRGSGLVIDDVVVKGKRRVDIKALMKKLNCY